MFKDFAAAVSYVESRRGPSDFTKVKALFAKYGNFQDKLKCAHVGGTNGKGSVVNYIGRVLIDAGYRVGVYTSPHLTTINERIKINDELISDEDFLNLINKFLADFEKENFSFFEIETFIAFYYFYTRQVDYCVIEVGLGGRLDATNALKKPLVTVITNVGFDHMKILGSTIERIAYEKAGIIKENAPIVIGCAVAAEAKEVIAKKARETHAVLIEAEKPTDVSGTLNALSMKIGGETYTTRSVALYQSENVSAALAALRVIEKEEGIKFDSQEVKRSVGRALWRGRFEKMLDKPLVYWDGAHNIHAMEALCATLDNIKKEGYAIKFVFAALKDKETAKMLERMLKTTADITVSEFAYERCKKARDTAASFPVVVKENWREAIAENIKRCGEKDILVITGSLYFLSAVQSYLLDLKRVRDDD